MASYQDDCLAVAAIDFGTTFSGYAFSFTSDKGNIYVNKNWGSTCGLTSFKTPTSVLTALKKGKNHKFQKFGYEAEHSYVQQLSSQNLDKPCLYNRFKMKLHSPTISDEIGKGTDKKPLKKIFDKRETEEADSIAIFAMALQYIKEHLLEYITELLSRKNKGDQCEQNAKGDESEGHGSISANYIRWVLTVPAIWSVRAKTFMRKAAHQAGLIETEASERLVLALEPEAASMYCKTLRMDNFVEERGSADLKMPCKTVYMVVDAGGGTVDMAVHQVMENGTVEEVCAASGGPWGGISIDKAFMGLLEDIWGQEFVNTIKEDFPFVWWEIETRLERAKKMVEPGLSNDLHVLEIGIKMAQLYQKITGKDITDINRDGVSINDDYQLVINKDTIDELFLPTVNFIVSSIDYTLSEIDVSRVDYMFLVGGLSNSKYLTQTIKTRFGNEIRILIPENPELAVLNGAVMFGENPDHINARVAQYTYGVKYYTKFDPKKHPQKNKVVIEGREKCKGAFSTLIKKGDIVSIGHEVEKTFYPVRSDATSGKYELFYSDKKDVMLVTEEGVETTGVSLTIPRPDISKGLDRPAEFRAAFGRTEIEIRARDTTNPDREWVKTTLNFSSY